MEFYTSLILLVVALVLIYQFKPRLIRLGPEQGLLRNRAYVGAGTKVFFERAYVVPALDSYDILDLSVQSLCVELHGSQGVHCRDNIRVDVKASLYLSVPRNTEKVLVATKVAGCAGISDSSKLGSLFEGKVTEALRTVFRQMDFEELLLKKEQAKDSLIESIGSELNCFHIEDIALESIDQTALEHLDPENILDAEGIAKIVERIAAQQVKAKTIQQVAEKECGSPLSS